MRSGTTLLTTVAAVVLSTETIRPALAVNNARPDFTGYYNQPKEINPQIARGGLQKLLDDGVLTRERVPSSVVRKTAVGSNQPMRDRRLNHAQTKRSHNGGGGK
jgi:hypothetical protein